MRKDFIQQNPQVTKTFVTGVAKAHEWLQVTPIDEVRARFSQIIRARQRNENLALIPYFSSYGVSEKGGLQKAADFKPWIDLLVKEKKLKPQQLNPNTIYSNAFNSYASPLNDK